MRAWHICSVMLVSFLLVGCGNTVNRSQEQGAIVEQALPPSIAAPPAFVDLPKWGVRNPHVHVKTRDGKVEFYSDSHGWNGHKVTLYYVPTANVEMYHGDYALQSRDSLQRITSAPLKKDGTWSAMWNPKGHELPDVFFVLIRTDIGQTTVEKMRWEHGKLLMTGLTGTDSRPHRLNRK